MSNNTLQSPLTHRNQQKIQKFDDLTGKQILSFSVVHFFNDLCTGCYYSYFVFYLNEILKFEYTSETILAGEMFNAILTLLMGILSDKTHTKIGKRLPCYIFGFIIVLISFILIWANPLLEKLFPFLQNNGSLSTILFYIFIPCLYNIGSASIFISHISLVPSLTCSRIRRDKLNSNRNIFTFVANLVLLTISLLVSKEIVDGKQQFQCLAFTCTGFGVMTSLFFLLTFREKQLTQKCEEYIKKIQERIKLRQEFHRQDTQTFQQQIELSSENLKKIPSQKQRFSNLQFYLYGIVYILARVYQNIIFTVLNFYLIEVLQFIENYQGLQLPYQVVLIHICFYISSILTSLFLNQLYLQIGRKNTFSFGFLIMIITIVLFAFMKEKDGFSQYIIYLVAIFCGFSQSIQLNTATNYISEVVGQKGDNGAFVFGFYTFIQKLVTGAAFFGIMNNEYFRIKDQNFIRWIIVGLSAFISGVSWVLVMLGKAKDYKKQKNKKKNMEIPLEDEFVS